MKFYGGTGFDNFTNVIQNNDGSFIAVGTTNSNDGDVSGNHGGDNDGWVVKLSANGNLLWQKCYGGSGDDQLTSVTKGSANTFVAAGFSTSNDGDVNENHGDYDGWVVKSDKKGNILEMNYNPVVDANLFTFTLIDEKGIAKPVVYFDAKPQDFERSEKVVVVGNMKNEQFIAKKILMKCPSKYQDGKFREAEKAVAIK